VDQELLAAFVPTQIALRERRAVVRRVGLAADEEDRAVGTLGAEGLRAARRRYPTPDDQEVDLALGHDAQ
jgi:hypothetical protein